MGPNPRIAMSERGENSKQKEKKERREKNSRQNIRINRTTGGSKDWSKN